MCVRADPRLQRLRTLSRELLAVCASTTHAKDGPRLERAVEAAHRAGLPPKSAAMLAARAVAADLRGRRERQSNALTSLKALLARAQACVDGMQQAVRFGDLSAVAVVTPGTDWARVRRAELEELRAAVKAQVEVAVGQAGCPATHGTVSVAEIMASATLPAALQQLQEFCQRRAECVRALRGLLLPFKQISGSSPKEKKGLPPVRSSTLRGTTAAAAAVPVVADGDDGDGGGGGDDADDAGGGSSCDDDGSDKYNAWKLEVPALLTMNANALKAAVAAAEAVGLGQDHVVGGDGVDDGGDGGRGGGSGGGGGGGRGGDEDKRADEEGEAGAGAQVRTPMQKKKKQQRQQQHPEDAAIVEAERLKAFAQAVVMRLGRLALDQDRIGGRLRAVLQHANDRSAQHDPVESEVVRLFGLFVWLLGGGWVDGGGLVCWFIRWVGGWPYWLEGWGGGGLGFWCVVLSKRVRCYVAVRALGGLM
jgi:hypothetical protein